MSATPAYPPTRLCKQGALLVLEGAYWLGYLKCPGIVTLPEGHRMTATSATFPTQFASILSEGRKTARVAGLQCLWAYIVKFQLQVKTIHA